ncbi:hypothetical protein WN944_014575 [Citrus x changshan-huyou]|uniref:Fatty acyl-CoA reductase n=1 Tax=Citrus x changshan-huyou TaxID=2935761 RepID=A0AAP0QLP4_9ROSI
MEFPFDGTVFVEKILRVQPNMKKLLLLLLRAADTESATVLGNDLFKIMKEKWCANFNSFISEKITLVPGDISCEDLGFKDPDLKEKIYDVAFGINTLEAMHVVNFAKKCFKLKVLVHVSTAYVSKKRRGLVLEKSVDGTSGLVIDVEKQVVEQGLNELIAEGASEKEIKLAMTHLVIKRAKMYGWPNTYVFTKAIGELLIQHLKESISVVILRPTVISSTYKQLFPYWAEDLRTINVLFAGPALGKLPCLVGDIETVFDVIPADIVVNAMIVAILMQNNLLMSIFIKRDHLQEIL